jgi:hypothetical protein
MTLALLIILCFASYRTGTRICSRILGRLYDTIRKTYATRSYLCRRLRILKRYLQNLSGVHKEEVVGVAHVLPIESNDSERLAPDKTRTFGEGYIAHFWEVSH